jgi:NADPH2:quinone reductase
MKQIRIYEQGDVDVMRYEDSALPKVPAGSVRVRIEAVGINMIDLYQRSGQYKMALPFTPGQEAAGVVDALGEGVTDFTVGDRVAYAFVLGAYAEYAIIPAARLVTLPASVSTKDAAALLLQGMTAHYLLVDTYPVKAGDTVLIHAAAGGTGQLLVQIAKLKGARVLATTSTEEKAALARSVGADVVALYDDFETMVKAETGGRGVDAVYDSVGKDTFERSLNCLRPRGVLALFGQSSGAVAPFDPQVLNAKGSLYLTRPSLGHYLQTREELEGRARDLFAWVGAGQLLVRIDREYGLAQAGEAHRALASRATSGKIVLVP